MRDVNVYRRLVLATKTDTVNLRVGYAFYKESNGKYEICNDENCSKLINEVSDLDSLEIKDYVTVSFVKASDEVYYYASNS